VGKHAERLVVLLRKIIFRCFFYSHGDTKNGVGVVQWKKDEMLEKHRDHWRALVPPNLPGIAICVVSYLNYSHCAAV
jgi:hypothetical protein